MAILNQQGIAETIAAAATADAQKLTESGSLFNSYMKNPGHNSPAYGFGYTCSGVELCYGDTEGFAAIMRAFRNLKEPMDPLEFGRRIAHALQAVVEPYPTGEHNLMYPHFLLHGIALDTADLAVAKILENARILDESRMANQKLKDTFGSAKEVLNGSFYLILINGFGDDFEALSLQLFKKRRGEPGGDEMYAKTGFHVDTPNATAYICNLQGRGRTRSQDPVKHKEALKKGREYGGFAHHYGSEPREFVLRELFQFLKANDVTTVKAIRPEEHVSGIGNHHGFLGKYDAILAQAGMEIESNTYRSKQL